MKPPFKLDERNVRIVHTIQSALYSITLVMIIGIVFYRDWALGQDFGEYRDIGFVLLFNSFFVVLALFYFGGITFQKLKPKYVIGVYIVFVLLVLSVKCIGYVFEQGSSSFGEMISSEIVIVLVICSLFTALCTFVAYMGKRKAEEHLE